MSALQAVKRFRIRELGATALPSPALVKPTPKTKLYPSSASSSRDKVPVASIENPFIPRLNPKTGRWAPPKYSLRQQALLVKKARESGTLALLPPGPKISVVEIAAAGKAIVPGPSDLEKSQAQNAAAPWTRPIEWTGEVKEKKVLGAEVGNRLYAGKKRMFKGHKWQRIAEKREKRRALLMRSMPKRIKEFKQYYKRRRPHPLKPPRTAKNAKLPF
ncbi:hypothetical protein BDR03DRAFT_897864 [Suillus americanus]|nr:hypothetical protein BDR03DRAFT_897864 [Suillus americanus]